MLKVAEIVSPDYESMVSLWDKYRAAYEGGKTFIDKYLQQFSARELPSDFEDRKSITYCPAHAKAAITDIKNAIYQRMVDITRLGGTLSYQKAITGEDSGIDLEGSSMTTFIGTQVLPEMLVMKRVGVYVDRKPFNNIVTKLDEVNQNNRPYVYLYKAEDIRAWCYDLENQLVSLLLRDTVDVTDTDTGLVVDTEIRFRLLRKIADGISVEVFDEDSNLLSFGLLNLQQIPFVMFEITDSLMADIADHQVALLNLASSDMCYGVKSNFPFYTEQYDPIKNLPYLKQSSPNEDGISIDNVSKEPEIATGPTQGRLYPKGTERPAFINPSAEPLKASMEKQESIKEEIRQLLALAVSNLQPRRQSADSKKQDDRGLEAGLSYIGLELEWGERQIAKIWLDYEKSGSSVTVNYPTNYTLKSDEERLVEAEKKSEFIPKLPSLNAQKALAKNIVSLVLGSKVSNELLKTINTEIDNATIVSIDPKTIREDIEIGILSAETASKARLYPNGEVEKAQAEHAKRAERIALAQSKANGSRGVDDLDTDTDSADKEKKNSQSPDISDNASKKTRGEGK